MMKFSLLLVVIAGLFSSISPLIAQPNDCDPEPVMAMISRAPDGTPGNDASSMYSVISGDGRYAAFASDASNLVPDDTNETVDVFMYDRLTCQTTRVSVNAEGVEGNDGSFPLKLSADGRYLLMLSSATNIDPAFVDDDSAGIFLLDTHEQVFTYIARFHLQADMSADARYIVYETPDLPSSTDSAVYLYDRITKNTQRITPENETPGLYFIPVISADGNYIAFASNGTAFAPGAQEGWGNTFLYERATGNTIFIAPIASSTIPMPFPSLSADGRYVVFRSQWTDELLDPESGIDPNYLPIRVYLYDRITEEIKQVSLERSSLPSAHAISADGRYITYMEYPWPDIERILVYDRLAGTTTLISVDTNGQPVMIYSDVNPTHAISGNGRFVVFLSSDPILTGISTPRHNQVFLTDWQALTGYVVEDSPQRNVYTTATPTLTWSPITWAAAYEIQVDDDADFSSPVYASTSLTVPEVTLPALADGVYHWRVRAQRANGVWGEWSIPDSFVVDEP